jgi:phosphoribosylglycinamide formyltransferase 1
MHGGPAQLAILVSGGGRTLGYLLEDTASGTIPGEVKLVIASRECPAAQRARAAGVELLVMPGSIPAAELVRVLRQHGIQWVVLAGYVKLLEIPPEYRGRVVNIHPALLPDFGGPGMYGLRVHQAVLNARKTESGCTVHLCDEEFDRGDIVLQRRCPVLPGDTPETLSDRVFALERQAYPEALRQLLAGSP